MVIGSDRVSCTVCARLVNPPRTGILKTTALDQSLRAALNAPAQSRHTYKYLRATEGGTTDVELEELVKGHMSGITEWDDVLDAGDGGAGGGDDIREVVKVTFGQGSVARKLMDSLLLR